MKLDQFKQIDFLPSIKALFKELNVPMNYVADEPTTAKEILKDTYKENETFKLVDDVYFVGMVDDAAFEGNQSLETEKIKSDYDGILIFGVTLNQRPNNLLPSRSQLAEISRAFNREFYYTPVVLVFKYKDDQKKYLAFANTERLKYKQEWREGEKAGKVSLLRDIDIQKPHAGHERIIAELQIPLTGRNAVDSFAKLYNYWQEVFNVSILNKKFYQELSNWYFWAIKHVKFPSEPTLEDAHKKGKEHEELIKEHNATNVIRLLTRLLFTWFIKEKKLVPEELFDLDALQKDILNEISPYHEDGMFKAANKESVYYRAILQNLFFASLNCPAEADETDNRTRQFRGDESYGKHRGIDWMMRYKKYFKNSDAFLQLMNKTVPFLNGGLFECLDDKTQNLYVDGFSDQMTKGEQLIVPDYLFFGAREEIDLSEDYGNKNRGAKQAAVKGLINILKSYKFTVTENTPIEEDVALDPELLGKVFENLLASYNPETKTTARKQTGSFYTPREIVNYMVDESLIAYLKNKILSDNSNAFVEFGNAQMGLFGNDVRSGQSKLYEEQSTNEFKGKEDKLDALLHELVSFNPGNPFDNFPKATKAIIAALNDCKILDPACGSGAFPMGILQKMVHILQKLDSQNKVWKEVQLEKARNESEAAFEIEDKQARQDRLLEINEAFDQNVNDPNYARKLFLIENCIYGVDIQPIAVQISKLRFFISLVVEQNASSEKANFGIRPLPNLETKFVAANTLIGIGKPKAQTSLFDTPKVKKLEAQLKKVRSKLFSAKTKETKLKYRHQDEELRHEIADELKENNWSLDNAEKLAAWDPYDQNESSTFFDPEWMFDVKAFDVLIGNPPYIDSEGMVNSGFLWLRENISTTFKWTKGNWDVYIAFFEKAFLLAKEKGVISYITPDKWLTKPFGKEFRKETLDQLQQLLRSGRDVFETVGVDSIVTIFTKEVVERFIYLDMIENEIKTIGKINKNIFQAPYQLDIVFSKYLKLLLDITDNNSILSTSFGVECENACATSDCYILKDILIDNTDQSFNNDDYYKVLNTGTINKFDSRWGKKDMTYLKDKYLCPVVKKKHFHKTFTNSYGEKADVPKLIIKGLTLLDATVDTHGQVIPGKSTLIIRSSDKEKLLVIAAIVNSKLSSFYVTQRYSAASYNTGVNFTKDMINNLPLPSLDYKEKNLLAFFTKVILLLKKMNGDVISLMRVMDAIVFNLYFPDHMKQQEIDVFNFVERDMQEVLQDREFDSLDDAEKEKLIEQLYATWSHPDNEVVKRIKQFKEKSPEILKPIMESR